MTAMWLKHAFKEWAVICEALATGRQSLILRKGGIDEPGGDGDFEVEHTRFWLFPTYVHQQPDGLQEAAWPLLQQAQAEKPPDGIVRLSHFAEVSGLYRVRDLAPVLLLAHLHVWSSTTVAKRFAYRMPQLYVLPVRVWKAAEVCELQDTANYQGCRSFVELDRELSTEGATPVLPESRLEDLHRQLDMLLNPTAIA
jgi:hypothetical protein